MRISILGPTYPFRGGIAHYNTLLSQELSIDNEVQLISFSRQYPKWIFPGKSDKDPSKKALYNENVKYCLDSLNPWTWIKTANIITRFEPNLVVLHWWHAFWTLQFLTITACLRKKKSIRILFICHNAIDHEGKRWKIFATRKILQKAHRIIVHSHEEKKFLLNIIGSHTDIMPVSHPSYKALYTNIPSKKTAKRQLKIQGKILLFFGFVRKYKGLDILLQALPLVLKHKKVTLLVVGEFWERKRKYLKMIQTFNVSSSVQLIDEYIPNENLGRFFAAADIVVLPYKTATGSGVCQMAQGFGKPIITTDIDGLREAVHDGLNGRIVPACNVIALAQTLLESLDQKELAKMTFHAGLSTEKFTWKHLARVICQGLDSQFKEQDQGVSS